MIMLRGGRGRFALIAGCALLSLFFLCGLVFASGGGEAAGHGDGKGIDLLKRAINFALMIIIIFVVVKKTALLGVFSKRIEDIKKKFDDLKAEKDAAEKRYEELDKKLKEFEEHKKEILAQFKADGAAEKERIIAEARERAEQILAQADQTIEREIEGARDRLRQEVVDAAARRAQEIIEKEIQDTDQDLLVTEFIEKVEKLH